MSKCIKDTTTKHIHVKNIKEAWEKADEIFPTDYIKCEMRTANAGYPIYVTTDDSRGGLDFCWISDLNTRLELNLPNNKTMNIWIEPDFTYTDYKVLSRAYGYLA